MSVEMAAHRQWSSRPDDERYLSLSDLRTAIQARTDRAWLAVMPMRDMKVLPTESGDLQIGVRDIDENSRQLTPTNYSFRQLCGLGNAPADYLQRRPADMAATDLQWSRRNATPRENSLVLADGNVYRSTTSTGFGRIWDLETVDMAIGFNHDGRWKVPAASYAASDPLRATTLYASDRDVWMMLVDDQNPVEVKGE